jgi:hypothetical protein
MIETKMVEPGRVAWIKEENEPGRKLDENETCSANVQIKRFALGNFLPSRTRSSG